MNLSLTVRENKRNPFKPESALRSMLLPAPGVFSLQDITKPLPIPESEVEMASAKAEAASLQLLQQIENMRIADDLRGGFRRPKFYSILLK